MTDPTHAVRDSQGATPISADPAPSAGLADLAPVYAVSYEHLGIILWQLPRLLKTLEQQIDRLERYPRFSTGWDHEAYTYDYLAEHAPAVIEKMKAMLSRFSGRIGIGSCTYGQPLSAFIDGESNIRQLTMAMDTAEARLGQGPSVYIMSEHAMHAQLPQLLVGAGFRGAILRTHFMMYGHNPEYDAPVGWWRGVDGSRITAVPTYVGQANVPARFAWKIAGPVTTLDNRILTDAVSEGCEQTLAEFRRAFGDRIRPLVATRADDPRSQESLLAAHAHDPAVRWIVLEQLLSLLPPPRAQFDAEPNDFVARMPWGYCGSWIWRRCREAEVRIQTAERLAAISLALGGEDHEADLQDAWKGLLVAQHHDIQICGLEDEAREHLGRAIDRAQLLTDTAMGAIAPRIGQGRRIVVFNPLAWQRTEWIDSDSGGVLATVPALGFAAVDAVGPRERTGPPDFQWQPEARDPMLFRYVRAAGDGEPRYVREHEPVGRLLTPFYEVNFAPTGGFRLVRDRRRGRELMLPPKTSGTLAAMVNGQDCVGTGRIEHVRVEPYRAVIVESGQVGPLPYSSEWTFYAHTPRIEWRGRVTFNGEWVGRPKSPAPAAGDRDAASRDATVTAFNDHEHKLRLRFYPFVGPTATGVRDLPFHVATTRDMDLQGLYWSALSDGRVGLALLNRGLMGSVREHDGAISAVLAFSLPYVWNTRILHGEYRYELAAWPFLGDWRAADLPRRAMEYNSPCVSRMEETTGSPLGEVWTPFRSMAGDPVLSALYTRRRTTYFRFAECRGESADVAFEWMGRPASLELTDLRQRRQCAVGRRYTLGPWQVQTMTIADQP